MGVGKKQARVHGDNRPHDYDCDGHRFVPTQRGDGEANFSCDWTDENIDKLIAMLKLRIRRDAPAHAFV